MAPTNVFFSPKVRSEQLLYEDILVEALRMYGQETYYIPRETITPDEILNEEYSKYQSTYMIEMYVANTDGFGGEGNLYTKFGLEIRDQATFIVSRRRFSRLVQIDENEIRQERPREGDLIYLPLSKGLFEIKYVEHESPFYQLSQFPTYELQCELFEYTAEKLETGIRDIDQFEEIYSPQTVIQIEGGTNGFAPGTKVKQVVVEATTDSAAVEIYGEVYKFVQTQAANSILNIPRQADLFVANPFSSDGSLRTFSTTGGVIERIDSPLPNDWNVIKVYGIKDGPATFIPQEPLSQNAIFETKADEIIDFSDSNPFGDPSTE
jgi:hypothetical protein